MAEKTGADRYAPPGRRSPLSGADEAAASAFEGEIRDFIRRDISSVQRQRSEIDVADNSGAEHLNALVRGVAGLSMDEIDRVIHELESVRDLLRHEGERVNREIAGYASLNHAATTAMKVIADSLKQWKDAQGTSKQIK